MIVYIQHPQSSNQLNTFYEGSNYEGLTLKEQYLEIRCVYLRMEHNTTPSCYHLYSSTFRSIYERWLRVNNYLKSPLQIDYFVFL